MRPTPRRGIGGALLLLLAVAPTRAADYYNIFVLDKAGAPIPGVRLVTQNAIMHQTDAAGRIHFYEPGLMGTWVTFGFDECVAKPGGGSWCNFDHAVACTTNTDCTGGHDPVTFDFFGCKAYFSAIPNEQKSVVVRLCDAGQSVDCYTTPGPGQCKSDVVVGIDLPNPVPTPAQRFKIKVVDAQTGRGVPLLEVRSPSARFVTDSAGVVAYHEAGLMGTTVHFDVVGRGYVSTSANLLAAMGGSATVPVTRENAAERLYRQTGGGIYRDTVLLGETPPIVAAVSNGLVLGQDTVQTTVYQNKIFWNWGDRLLPNGPPTIGVYRALGGLSDLPSLGGLDPNVGVNLAYYNQAGPQTTICNAADFPDVPGIPNYCWIFSPAVFKSDQGAERLYALYLLSGVESGFAKFDDVQKRFKKLSPELQLYGLPISPGGQPEKLKQLTKEYQYYQNPVRIEAKETKLIDPANWEAFTALKENTTNQIERRTDDTAKYVWRFNSAPITPATPVTLAPEDKLYGHERDPETGTATGIDTTSSAWNPHRRRWARVFEPNFFFIGDVWYGEADTPMGPWVYGRRIVRHDYEFYQVRQHPYFNQAEGRYVFFEGTYTKGLTSAVRTPRYDYNQIMYRLDVDDPRAVVPVPVYDWLGPAKAGNFITKGDVRPGFNDDGAVFMAPDRAGLPGTIPFWWNDPTCKATRQLVVGGTPQTTPVFWALPGSPPPAPSDTMRIALYEFSKNGNPSLKSYSTAMELTGYTLNPNPIAKVWKNPITVHFPVTDHLPSLMADAGNDRCITASAATGLGTIGLRSSASRNTEGTITSYHWTWTGPSPGSANGPSPDLSLPPGLYDFTLTITGSGGDTSTDNCIVRISPP